MTDASLQKIAATYGTPTFVFDTDALQARVRAIQTIWGREIDLCYSIKANPFLLPAMMQVTARLEVCSPGELSLCESLHAADARVIYSGVNKRPWILPAPWPTASAPAQRNPCCKSAICRMLHARPPNGCLCCCG